MAILITGKGGQIASCLEKRASETNIKFTALNRQHLNLTSLDSIESAICSQKPSIVINASGFTNVEAAESASDKNLAVNSVGAENLARICNKYNIPVILLSTDYVFDGRQPQAYSETDATCPVNRYGRSKLKGEQSLAAGNPQHIILRTAWLHSPYRKNFVKTLLDQARAHKEVHVVNDQSGCPTYGLDLADGIIRIIQMVMPENARSVPWGIYNIGNQGVTNWSDFARYIFACSAKRGGPTARVTAISTSDLNSPVTRPANSQLDFTKLQKTFNISLPSWQNGVFNCVTEILGNEKNYT